ncbi:terminase small subunit, partial [Bacillus thuringiensis]|nr:terminase small subunit [Bacillus thuringiensis]
MDVLKEYIKIAFADITNYVTFGQKEVPVMGMFGPMKDEAGNEITRIINYVDLHEADMVDGSIITEVKQGRDGISVKLADKMKALDKLSLYFDLFPDNFKRKVDEERLHMQQEAQKVQIEKTKAEIKRIDDGDDDSTIEITVDYGDDDE